MKNSILKVNVSACDSNAQFKEIIDHIQMNGAIIIKDIITSEEVKILKRSLLNSIEDDKIRRGEDYLFYGMVHALMTRDSSFRDLIENSAILKIIRGVLGHGAILHAYNSSSMPPNKTNFSRSIHVDCPRLIPNYITNVGMTLALDPFTKNNGAMEIMPFSFNMPAAPSESEFAEKAMITDNMEAGDALFFNARCWHRGGLNSTAEWRHSVTMNCCRSFMRQQFDFPKMFNESESQKFSDDLRQMLGYFVRMPKSMDEFLLPSDQRLYKPGQE